MDIAKFIWLLKNQKLHMARLDLLNDPHEGSIPGPLAKIRDQKLMESGSEELASQIPVINRQFRKSMYVNCWHLGNAESEAMWRLYCPDGNGVAIRTTYSKLIDSINNDEQLYIGKVTYIDYSSQGFDLNNGFYPVMHKRISFKHEQEVHIVKSLPKYWSVDSPPSPHGIKIDWQLNFAIEEIYVNPYAPEYYYDSVRSVVESINPEMKERVMWSSMKAAPVY